MNNELKYKVLKERDKGNNRYYCNQCKGYVTSKTGASGKKWCNRCNSLLK